MDKFTETTHTSYGQNIGNSFKGILVGVMMLMGAISLLWWNEGRSVDQQNALEEMQSHIVAIPDAPYEAGYDGKAVLVQGEVKPLNALVDPQFGVTSDGLILRRSVEMYQWRENTSSKSEDKLGGGTETVTTYSYVKEWSSGAIDSSGFKHPQGHENPPMQYKNETFVTDAVLGDYELYKNVVGYIHANSSYHGLNDMPDMINGAKNKKTHLYIPTNKDMNRTTPMIGDVKITYHYAPSGVYTFAAKSYNRALTPYTTTNGKDLLFVRPGKVSAQSIFQSEFKSNNILTWVLRVVGLVLMYIAFNMLMGILPTLAKVIPMLGTFIGVLSGVVSAVLTLIVGSFVIALAWFASRPMLSLGIIAGGIILAFLVAKFSKK
jgi:hypothetical protein